MGNTKAASLQLGQGVQTSSAECTPLRLCPCPRLSHHGGRLGVWGPSTGKPDLRGSACQFLGCKYTDPSMSSYRQSESSLQNSQMFNTQLWGTTVSRSSTRSKGHIPKKTVCPGFFYSAAQALQAGGQPQAFPGPASPLPPPLHSPS